MRNPICGFAEWSQPSPTGVPLAVSSIKHEELDEHLSMHNGIEDPLTVADR
jgi:hypothetical protein